MEMAMAGYDDNWMDGYTGYTPYEETGRLLVNSFDNHITTLKQQIQRLEAKKKQMIIESQTVRPPIKPCWSIDDSDMDIVDTSKVRGFILSDYFCANSPTGNGEITYSATCNGHFMLSVSTLGEQITLVQLSLDDTSPLREIGDILLPQQCPSTLLLMIQQFMHLNHCRKEVVCRLASYKSSFRIILPRFLKHCRYSSVCHIMAKKNGQPVLDLEWTMEWSQECHSLKHKFTSKRLKDPPLPGQTRYAEEFASELESAVFVNQNEDQLVRKWEEFCKWIR